MELLLFNSTPVSRGFRNGLQHTRAFVPDVIVSSVLTPAMYSDILVAYKGLVELLDVNIMLDCDSLAHDTVLVRVIRVIKVPGEVDEIIVPCPAPGRLPDANLIKVLLGYAAIELLKVIEA